MGQTVDQLPEITSPSSSSLFVVGQSGVSYKVQKSNLNIGTFNVKDYGALGNNSNNDTSAIQAAVTAAAVNGGILFFPPGIYHSTGITNTSPNVLWRGSGLGTIIVAITSSPAVTFTGQAFVEDIVFDGSNTATNVVVQSVITESSYPSVWKNVVWQNATSYQYVNSGCEDVSYIACKTQGDESFSGNPHVLPAMQLNIPFGAVTIIGGSIFGKVDMNYQQITISGATIGPLYIENPNPQNNTILNLDGCYLYDGGANSDNCINTGTNLSNVIAKGCYFVGQSSRAWINGNIPTGVTITIDNCVFIWGPGTSGNNYLLQASGAGTLELRSYSLGIGSATFNIFNPVSSPTTIIKTPPNEHATAVASASSLTLPVDANFFQISGSTTINGIDETYHRPGDIIYLSIQGSITIKHNTGGAGNFKPIILNGAVDFVGVANNTITLIWDSIGNAWFELARKV